MFSEEFTILLSVSIFLLVNLAVGLWVGRKVNSNSLQDYALGNKSMGTGALTITFISTMIGANYLTSKISDSWDYGALIHVCQSLSLLFTTIMLGWFIFPKLMYFEGCYTLGDITGRMYGREAQLLTGIISCIFSMLIITAQLILVGHLCDYIGLSEGSRKYIIAGMGFVLVLYTWFGGIRSVTMTDIVQFILIIVGFTIISNFALNSISTSAGGGVPELFSKVWALDKELLGKGYHFNRMLLSNIFLIIYPTIFFGPPIIQRVLMTKNKYQLKRVLISVSSFYAVFRFIILIIGFCLLVTTQNKHLDANEVVQGLIVHIFKGSLVVKILFVMIALAITMSTADSYLNALSISMVRDIIKPMASHYKKEVNDMQYIRYMSVLFGLNCTVLAIVNQTKIPAIFYSFSLFSLASIVLPCIVGILGLKVNMLSFYGYIVSYFLMGGVAIILAYFDCLGIGETVIIHRKLFYIFPVVASIASGVFFALVYKIEGGFIWVKRASKERHNWRLESLKTRVFFLSSPVEWAREQVTNCGSQPTSLPIFFSVLYMFPNITAHVNPQGYNKLLSGLSLVGLFLCIGLLLRKLWPLVLKRYFDLYWFVVLCYCIPFSNTLLFLYNPEDRLTFVQMSLAILLLIVLVEWRIFFGIGFIGIFLAVFMHICLVPSEWHFKGFEDFDMLWSIFFGLGGTILIGLLFASRKELANANRIRRAKLLASAFGHDLRNSLFKLRFPAIVKLCEKMEPMKNKEGEQGVFMKEADYEQLKSLAVDGKKELGICRNDIRMFEDLVKHDKVSSKDTAIVDIRRVLEGAVGKVHPKYRDKVFIEGGTDLFEVELYPDLFHHVIINLVKNAFWHGGAERVSITWEATSSTVYIADDGRGIPAEVQPRIFDLFYTTNGNGIGLPFVRMVVEAADGQISLFKTEGKGTTFAIVFPKVEA